MHYALTERKLSILDRLTARLTYGVWLWSNLFEEHSLEGSYADRAKFYEQVKAKSRLPAHMVQCCFDTAKWMWESHRQLHGKWRRIVAEAESKNKRKTLHKLMKREPQKPFMNGLNQKIPIWFDSAIGSIERSKSIRLCPYVARVSTLRRGTRITLPLNPAKYHLDLLEKARSLRSFQLVNRNGKYRVHVKIEYTVPDRSVDVVRGIDLGVRRSIASVTLRANQPLRSSDFALVRDGLKVHRLNLLNQRIARLQCARKWGPLKRARHKRLHVAEYFDRLSAKAVAETSDGCLVVVGYPEGIKYDNYKGNGKAHLRRLLARWSYARVIQYIREECSERGVTVDVVRENWSSATCHRCSSRYTERITQSLFHCWSCALWYNADFNAAINIGSPFLPKAANRRATVGLAHAGSERAREIVAREPRSPEN